MLGPDGKLAEGFNSKIEDAWKYWNDDADLAKRQSRDEMIRLAKRQEEETGNYLFAKVHPKDGGRYLPFAMAAYEVDWLTSAGTSPNKNHELKNGIEYEKSTGRTVAYWLEDPDSWGKPKRIPAENIIHGFETVRAGQLLAVSPFAPAVLLADALRDFVGSELDSARMASKYLGIITTNNPGAFQNGRADTETSTNKRVEELDTAILEYVGNGEKVEFANPARPGDGFERFARFAVRVMAITRDLPYSWVSGDTSGLNYSTMRAINNQVEITLKPVQLRYTRLYQSIYNEFLDWAVLKGRLNLPGYFSDPWPWRRAQWFAPVMASPDPLKEINADVKAMAAGLRSPQEICAKQGRDFATVVSELEAAKKMLEKAGITVNLSQTTQKTNPAALAKES